MSTDQTAPEPGDVYLYLADEAQVKAYFRGQRDVVKSLRDSALSELAGEERALILHATDALERTIDIRERDYRNSR